MLEWHSIKDGLPPVGYPLIVTIYDSCHGRRELRYPVVYRQSFWTNDYGFYCGEDYLMPEYSKVLAWVKVPNVYERERE